ncbi:MAG: VWA domain-containing protein, partial [bacterium]
NSYSMNYTGLEGEHFKLAKDKAIQILDLLKPGDNASLILMSDTPDTIFQKLTSDIAQVKSAVSKSKISHKGTYILPSIIKAYSMLKESKNPLKKIYIITDLAENGWSEWESIPSDIMQNDVELLLVKIGDIKDDNRAIEEIKLSNDFVGVGIPIQINAKIKRNDKSKINVELIIDGVKKGQLATENDFAIFNYTFNDPGIHKCEVRLESDKLLLDDVRYLVVNVLGEIKVLVVGNNKFYTNLALNPTISSETTPSLIIPISCDVNELGNQTLSKYSVVILVDVARLSDLAISNLRNFYQNGGNIIVFIGKNADRDWYNSIDFIPISLGKRENFQTPLKFSKWDLQHSILKIFGTEETDNALKSPEFYSAFSIIPKTNAKILANYSRNIPAILEMKKRGSIILFNTSPDPDVTDLPLNPVFLPIMQQTILYLSSEREEKNILVRETYSVNTYERIDSAPEILNPENIILKPVVSDSISGNGRQIICDTTEYAGFYKIEFSSEGTKILDYFAVNLNTKGESSLKSASKEEILRRFGDSAKFISEDFSQETKKQEKISSEISPILLIIAVILMIVEIPLANRRVPSKKEGLSTE